MSEWRHARSERLLLDLPVGSDVEELFAIHADPASWRHLPSGVMTERAHAEAMVPTSARQFDDHGLGYWTVRAADAGPGGPVLGRAGCAVPEPERPWWNLYYRLASAAQGHGYAREVAAYAVAAAQQVQPERPVLAYLLEHNTGSRRVAESIGLRLCWRGPDLGNPDPEAVRLVYVDRDPDAALSAAVDDYCRRA